ncbi:hypothetical protein ALC53_08350 [Atta colombica]|uniref:Uncharacterized protein n=1 Tax=Atta colombica TaxID=520822 RepID=A0A195BAR5_9HYME|nr:hypothetical protein ALC53_08350 [Atta colombica]
MDYGTPHRPRIIPSSPSLSPSLPHFMSKPFRSFYAGEHAGQSDEMNLVYQQDSFKEPSILEYLRYSEIEYFSKAASHASPVCLTDPYLSTAIEAYSKPHTKRIDTEHPRNTTEYSLRQRAGEMYKRVEHVNTVQKVGQSKDSCS